MTPKTVIGEIVDPVADVRHRAFSVEHQIRQMPPVELIYKHYFSDGVYAREMFIPKGTVVTGKVHKFQNLNIMVKGDLSVLTEKGVVRVKPPFVVVSPPGTKRLAYAHEDTIWLTVLRTDETEPGKIEALFVADSEQEFLEFIEQQKLLEKEI